MIKRRIKAENNENPVKIKEKLTKIIKKANTIYLTISFVLLGLSVLFVKYWSLDKIVFFILSCFVLTYCLSRTLDICVTFVKDVFDGKFDTSLKKNDRIKLALKTVVEEALLFTCVYLYIFRFNVRTDLCFVDFIKCLGNGCFSLSASMSGLDATYLLCEPFSVVLLFKAIIYLVPIYQTMCAGILIVLAVAKYMSLSNEDKALAALNSAKTFQEDKRNSNK